MFPGSSWSREVEEQWREEPPDSEAARPLVSLPGLAAGACGDAPARGARLLLPGLLAGLLLLLTGGRLLAPAGRAAAAQELELLAEAEHIATLQQGTAACSRLGESCDGSGCCVGAGVFCYSPGCRGGVPVGGATCRAWEEPGESRWTRRKEQQQPHTTWKAHGVTCHSRFVVPPMPLDATEYNGIDLAPTCFNGSGPHTVFVISNWGGIVAGNRGNRGNGRTHIAPADHTPFGANPRKFVKEADEWAQFQVALHMQKRAGETKPDYILNGGDSFHWGGIEAHCGMPPSQYANTGQWKQIFEQMYIGPGIEGKQWLGVLGNQDYGGWTYLSAWDQTIGYTWGGPESTGRWTMPAQYWKAPVHYEDFAVEYYFVDTNYFTAGPRAKASDSDICNGRKAATSRSQSCGTQGPVSARDCPGWFARLWEGQKAWLDRELARSRSQWQIVVTHFPPTWGREEWPALARNRGVDLIVAGHERRLEVHVPEDPLSMLEGQPGLYSDFMGGTGWIVAGGGGGITSEGTPDEGGNDDQYGFVELSLERYKITIRTISHGGQIRSTKELRPIPPALAGPGYLAQLTREQLEMERPSPQGCGANKRTFYVYRAQDDKTYPDENINAANLAGVLWYLHHEVVMVCPRKFGITRIRRMRVTVQNPCDLYDDTKTQFGPYTAFDSGKCGVAGCENTYYRYGSVVGCQHIPFNTGLFAAYCEYPNCGYAHWYSFPGPCTKEPFWLKSDSCKAGDPGGKCDRVTGQRDCTYSLEDAGEVYLDELYQTTSKYYPWKEFCKKQIEYNNQTDSGIGVSFWNGIYNPAKCMERYLKVTEVFKRKYPSLPESLPEPRCDFYESDPHDFFSHTGSGFSRSSTQRELGV